MGEVARLHHVVQHCISAAVLDMCEELNFSIDRVYLNAAPVISDHHLEYFYTPVDYELRSIKRLVQPYISQYLSGVAMVSSATQSVNIAFSIININFLILSCEVYYS